MDNTNEPTMLTRSKLIEKLAEHHPNLTTRDVEEATKKIFEYMIVSLSNGRRIEIRGFGSFSLRTRKQYIARNPKTGQRFPLSRKSFPYFRSGKRLREEVNKSMHCSLNGTAAESSISVSPSTLPNSIPDANLPQDDNQSKQHSEP